MNTLNDSWRRTTAARTMDPLEALEAQLAALGGGRSTHAAALALQRVDAGLRAGGLVDAVCRGAHATVQRWLQGFDAAVVVVGGAASLQQPLATALVELALAAGSQVGLAGREGGPPWALTRASDVDAALGGSGSAPASSDGVLRLLALAASGPAAATTHECARPTTHEALVSTLALAWLPSAAHVCDASAVVGPLLSGRYVASLIWVSSTAGAPPGALAAYTGRRIRAVRTRPTRLPTAPRHPASVAALLGWRPVAPVASNSTADEQTPAAQQASQTDSEALHREATGQGWPLLGDAAEERTSASSSAPHPRLEPSGAAVRLQLPSVVGAPPRQLVFTTAGFGGGPLTFRARPLAAPRQFDSVEAAPALHDGHSSSSLPPAVAAPQALLQRCPVSLAAQPLSIATSLIDEAQAVAEFEHIASLRRDEVLSGGAGAPVSAGQLHGGVRERLEAEVEAEEAAALSHAGGAGEVTARDVSRVGAVDAPATDELRGLSTSFQRLLAQLAQLRPQHSEPLQHPHAGAAAAAETAEQALVATASAPPSVGYVCVPSRVHAPAAAAAAVGPAPRFRRRSSSASVVLSRRPSAVAAAPAGPAPRLPGARGATRVAAPPHAAPAAAPRLPLPASEASVPFFLPRVPAFAALLRQPAAASLLQLPTPAVPSAKGQRDAPRPATMHDGAGLDNDAPRTFAAAAPDTTAMRVPAPTAGASSDLVNASSCTALWAEPLLSPHVLGGGAVQCTPPRFATQPRLPVRAAEPGQQASEHTSDDAGPGPHACEHDIVTRRVDDGNGVGTPLQLDISIPLVAAGTGGGSDDSKAQRGEFVTGRIRLASSVSPRLARSQAPATPVGASLSATHIYARALWAADASGVVGTAGAASDEEVASGCAPVEEGHCATVGSAVALAVHDLDVTAETLEEGDGAFDAQPPTEPRDASTAAISAAEIELAVDVDAEEQQQGVVDAAGEAGDTAGQAATAAAALEQAGSGELPHAAASVERAAVVVGVAGSCDERYEGVGEVAAAAAQQEAIDDGDEGGAALGEQDHGEAMGDEDEGAAAIARLSPDSLASAASAPRLDSGAPHGRDGQAAADAPPPLPAAIAGATSPHSAGAGEGGTPPSTGSSRSRRSAVFTAAVAASLERQRRQREQQQYAQQPPHPQLPPPLLASPPTAQGSGVAPSGPLLASSSPPWPVPHNVGGTPLGGLEALAATPLDAIRAGEGLAGAGATAAAAALPRQLSAVRVRVDALLAGAQQAVADMRPQPQLQQRRAPGGGARPTPPAAALVGSGDRVRLQLHRARVAGAPAAPDAAPDAAAAEAATRHVAVELHSLRSGLARLRAEVAGARRESARMARRLGPAVDGARRAELYRRVAEDATVKLHRAVLRGGHGGGGGVQ